MRSAIAVGVGSAHLVRWADGGQNDRAGMNHSYEYKRRGGVRGGTAAPDKKYYDIKKSKIKSARGTATYGYYRIRAPILLIQVFILILS